MRNLIRKCPKQQLPKAAIPHTRNIRYALRKPVYLNYTTNELKHKRSHTATQKRQQLSTRNTPVGDRNVSSNIPASLSITYICRYKHGQNEVTVVFRGFPSNAKVHNQHDLPEKVKT